MIELKFVLTLLACFCAVQSFTCPEDSHSFYHADVSTGCQVYHHCENSEMHTFTCPTGEAFNYETSSCADASTVNCYETMDDHAQHHHHKRAVEEYHTINIAMFKHKVKEAYNLIKPILLDTIKDISPSIYAKLEKEYLPVLRSAKEELSPFFNQKIYPRIQEWLRFSKRAGGKLIEKTYKSYEVSNSTHVTLVSLSDIVEDFFKTMDPVLRLGKFLSSAIPRNTERLRNKRSSFTPSAKKLNNEELNIYRYIIARIHDRIIDEVKKSFLGRNNEMIVKRVVPMFYKMIEDKVLRDDALSIIWFAKVAFTPLELEMSKKQTFDESNRKVIRIPRELYTEAIEKFISLTDQIISRIAFRLFTSTDLSVRGEKVDDIESLSVAVSKFITKQGILLKTSPESHFNFFPLTEILDDLKPIQYAFTKLCSKYYNSENILMRALLGRNGPSPQEVDEYLEDRPKMYSTFEKLLLE